MGRQSDNGSKFGPAQKEGPSTPLAPAMVFDLQNLTNPWARTGSYGGLPEPSGAQYYC